MRISARNTLKGRIVSIKKGCDHRPCSDRCRRNRRHIGHHQRGRDDLGLAEGQEAYAVIKASDVMIGVD